jgi:hypothetical protein
MFLKICKNCGDGFDKVEDDFCCLECKENYLWALDKK